jgi:hypothetical protein
MSRRRPVAPPPHILREYALLADGERGIVVGPQGEFCWGCLPRWDSDAVFSSLIGGRGFYSVTPRERFVWGGWYEPGTLIWRSRWVTSDNGVIECREALALPADPERAVILRRVAALAGAARVRVTLAPRAGFDRHGLSALKRDSAGCWRGRTGDLRISASGLGEARADDGALELELTVPEGEHHDLAVVVAAGEPGPVDAELAWHATEAGWRERVPALGDSIARRDARHAYAVLAGLTGASGGMVAAATTSLPERARDGRNYDYRYVWIRDQCYAGQAVGRHGPHPLLDQAVAFVRDRLLADGSRMAPAYTVDGEPVPRESRLPLAGYPGGSDKVGNHVRDQFQLDAFGEALLLFAGAAGHDRMEADTWQAAELAARAIGERWREPDAGIWELEPQCWTHSRLICAAGLRAISRHAPGAERAAGWLSLADELVAWSATHAAGPRGHWQRSPGDERVDAALLLPAIRGAVAADDPRSIATLRAVERELTEDGYCYRFRHDGRPLGEAEGAFLLCGYLIALARSQLGDRIAAARWLERSRAACGPSGLYTEEFDVRQRQLRGNLPQAFVHALLLECAADHSLAGEASSESAARDSEEPIAPRGGPVSQ